MLQGRSMRAIAADLGRAPSTISREVAAHADAKGRYRAKRAHAVAFETARRPQASKIEANPALRDRVVAGLTGRRRLSPEQVAGRLRQDFPEDAEMWVHHETIYRWIYLQPRGQLKAEVSAALRTGRAMRRPNKHAHPDGRGQIPDMVSIHDRPPV
ncbi:transposase, partial [Aeromicrobium sp. CF4.19]|uniref:transposase n=1 Tax=Aeromicrobium sp. CF4.19 TaxID=3373082 RepID=UPI003EE63EE6